MRHIKTKLLLFIISAVTLSCIVTNLVSASLLRNLYLEELYTSSENTARQLLLTSDTTVNTVESSMTLIFDSRGINTLLTQTDFRRENGHLSLAIQDLDSIMDNFKIQFEKFTSLLFCGSKGGIYRYHYYNGNLISYANSAAKRNTEWAAEANFRWEGVYRIGNQLTPPDRDEAYVVSKSVISPTDLKYAGLAVAFFEPDLFTDKFADAEQASGGRAILLDKSGRPAAGYRTVDLLLIANTRERLAQSGGKVTQFVTGDGQQMITAVKSETTGWSLIWMMPLSQLTEKVNTALAWGLGVVAAVIGVTLFCVYYYVRVLSRSITEVSQAMTKVGGNDFSVRLHTTRRDEIGDIYAGFNVMSENLDALFHRAVEKEREKKEAEIRALIYQIKPHFLYNTLASIRMYAMMEGAEQIAGMLATLNRLLRNTINIGDRPITVADELANLRDYIEIYRLRYQNRIAFEIEPEEEVLQCLIPNMLLQPVVENAIDHGFAGSISESGRNRAIRVAVYRQAGELYLTVTDNGDGMSDVIRRGILSLDSSGSRAGHIGLRNIHERLQSLYGEEYGVTIESEKYRYTKIILKVKEEYDAADTDCR